MQYRILTSSRSRGISEGLTYEATKKLKAGSAVKVPLRNSFVEGIVIEAQGRKRRETFALKQVQKLLSDQPLLLPHQLKLLQWMAEEYFCSLRQAVSAFLPGTPWAKMLPDEMEGYRLGRWGDGEMGNIRGKKQIAVVDYLHGKEWVSEMELKESTGASAATTAILVKKGLIEKESRPSTQRPGSSAKALDRPTLTKLQHAAYLEIRNATEPSLLFGITGSGKTEIYAQLIADCIEGKLFSDAQRKQAILLVPEILLTEHCIHRFEKLLDPSRIAVMHSRLTSAKRRAIWKKIRSGGIDLVIGSRSALFAPVERLGLVIIDEEHEWTYKNEHAPRYHARETADALCRFAKAKLVLGTATPSLESWARARTGDVGPRTSETNTPKSQFLIPKSFHLVRLPTRYGNQSLPTVRIIDLATVSFGSLYPFSPPLLEAIEERLKRREQSILFLNRRGSATGLLCLDCRRRVVSPDSKLPFTVHRKPDGRVVLVDHTTNLIIDPPMFCAHCGSGALQEVGAGTQRIERTLRRQFPKARLLRADSDALKHPGDMRELLAAMREERADILLGTQSVVKGLDLPNVTFAAVLLADVGLSLPHFRAGERIFQLLTQLTGRSGRAKSGEVIIQTFRPNAPEVTFAAEHKTEEYLQQELKLRLYTGYPPASRMVRLVIKGRSAFARAQSLCTEIAKVNREQSLDLAVSSAPTLFGGGNIWHVLIRGSNPRSVLKNLNLEGVIVDIDPIECV